MKNLNNENQLNFNLTTEESDVKKNEKTNMIQGILNNPELMVSEKSSSEMLEKMQSEYKKYMTKNKDLFDDLTFDEIMTLGLDFSNEAERYKLVEEAIVEYYNDIVTFRETEVEVQDENGNVVYVKPAEDVSSYWRKTKSDRDAKGDAGEADAMGTTAINCLNPVEKYGMMEVLAKKFNDGINTGTCFENSARNYYLEIGMNPNEVYDSESDEFVTFYGVKANEERRKADAKQLVKEMEFTTNLRAETNAKIEAVKGLIIPTIEEKIRNLNHKELTYKQAKQIAESMVAPTINSIISEATEGKRNLPFPSVKTVSNIDILEAGSVDAAFEKAKGLNTQYLAEMYAHARAFISQFYTSEFDRVQSILEGNLIAVNGEISILVQAIKSGSVRINKEDVIKALEIARDRNSENRFTSEEFQVLSRSGLVPSRVSGKNPKASIVISEETKKLIASVQEGNLSVVTKDNARSILEAAAKGGSQYRLEKEMYFAVKNIAA